MTRNNPENTALIVIDMQNDFVHPDGELYAPPSGDAVEPVKELVEQADRNDVPIIFTKDIHNEEQFEDAHYYDEYDRWGEHVKEGTWGAEIVEELEADEYADYVVEKPTYNAFHNTELDEWLSENGIDNLVICGTLANVCVLHTASGAGLRDYKPVVVEDALGYLEESDLDYAVDHAGWLFGEKTFVDDVNYE
jgi:nicotinamidase-related amidase